MSAPAKTHSGVPSHHTWRGVLGHLAGIHDLSGHNGLARFTEDSTNLWVLEWGSFQRHYAAATPAYGFFTVGKTLKLGPTVAAGVAFNRSSVEGFLVAGLEAELSLLDLLKKFRKVREVLEAAEKQIEKWGGKLEGEILKRLEPLLGKLPKNFVGDQVKNLLRHFPAAAIEKMIGKVEDFFKNMIPRISVSGKVGLFFGQTDGRYYLRIQDTGKFEVNFGLASGIPVVKSLNQDLSLQRSWQLTLAHLDQHWPTAL
jgi:hypothetical protein